MTENNHEKDDVTGVETTGHEWDGLKELNNPAPMWWLIVFVITVVWSIGYWVIYPAWPTLSGEGERGGTPGTAGWTQYSQLAESQAEIVERRAAYMADFEGASFEEIRNNQGLYAFAIAGGQSAFKDNCATCHGTGGAGAPGYPNLNDDAWLWGGSVDEIHVSIQYGVRADNINTHYSLMPAFQGILSSDEISTVADYVLALGTGTMGAGQQLYLDNCAACHGDNGYGDKAFGAPNLADAIWHYGGTKAEVMQQIAAPKHGLMPAWEGRLDAETIRQLAVYVHSLGGGEE